MNISVLFDTCTIKLKLDKRKPKDTMSMMWYLFLFNTGKPGLLLEKTVSLVIF